MLTGNEYKTTPNSYSVNVNPHPRMRYAARISAVAVYPAMQGKGIGSQLMVAAIDLALVCINPVQKLSLQTSDCRVNQDRFGYTSELSQIQSSCCTFQLV